MEALKILERNENLSWDYDGEADVLYISVGEPGNALGVDVGDGVVIRYNEDTGEMVGLTIIGVRQRSISALK
ncbi:MAG: DUF2283 domain-containing protein [Nitrospirae bacterium]|nr:DUF2283 domain-containing protein [Nitrospirota bacterium]MBI5696658.1 DUF2283 domain-containing protein [Nitrospirota bacterium]